MSQKNQQDTLLEDFQKELNKYQAYLSKQFLNIQSFFQSFFGEEFEEKRANLFFSLVFADQKLLSEKYPFQIDSSYILTEDLSYILTDPSGIIDLMKCMMSGFTPNQILYLALENRRREQFIDLALTNKVNFNEMYELPSSTSITCLEKCINHGLSLNNASQLILNSVAYNDKDKISQEKLVKFLLEKNASFEDAYNIPSYFSYETYESLLTHGLEASTLLENIFEITDADIRARLIDLALGYEVDFDSIYYYLASSITSEELKKFLKHGLKASRLLKEAFRITDADIRARLIDLALGYEVDFDSFYSLPSSITSEELEKFLKHGLSLNKAFRLILNSVTFNDKNKISKEKLVKFLIEKNLTLGYEVDFDSIDPLPSSITPEELEKFLKHGLKASRLLEEAFRITDADIRARLIDLALGYEVDFDSIYFLPSSITSEELEKFLKHGLSLIKASRLILNSVTYNDKDKISQEKLVKFLLEKNASFENAYNIPSYFSYETYKSLLTHGLEASTLLENIFKIKDADIRASLIDLALEYEVDFYSIDSLPSSITSEELEKFLFNGLTTDRALSLVLGIKQPDNFTQEFQNYLYNLIELLINKGADINPMFARNISASILDLLIKEYGLELLIKEHRLNPNNLLEHGLRSNNIDSLRVALKYNADVTTISEDKLATALRSKNIEILSLLNEHGVKISINREYIEFIKNENFSFKVYVVKAFTHIYNQDRASEILRYNGGSELDIKQFFDLHNLVNDYILAKNGIPNILGTAELTILDNQINIANIDEYNSSPYLNRYGYQALHLAIIANRNDLAEQMIQAGFNVYAQSHNHMTPLQLFVNMFLSTTFNGDRTEITRIISEVIGEVDVKLDSGQTLADRLITNYQLGAKIIEKSKDPLFYLFKQDADLFSLSQDTSKTHIAISHGTSFWSTGIWSTARLLTKNHPNVKFYLVNHKVLAKGGEAFFKQFDAVINPGADDSYPRNSEGFKKEDCPFNNQLEKHYQNTLELSDKFAIPYLGICAGAQHFSMYHGGSLKLLNRDNIDYFASLDIKFVEGTLPYYLSLTKEQQTKALSDCDLPKISFSGDRAHSFAAIIGQLGDNIELGAISGDQVAMSYAHSNGIRYATQYHPEHYYKYDNQNSNALHQKAWLDNFVELAEMHHSHRMNNNIVHPIEHYTQIKARLEICITAPTCLGDEPTYESLFLN